MSLIQPFAALRPAPGRAADVAAPPYDVMNTAEARAMVSGRPHSFLHVSRAEIDLPADTDPYSAAVYACAAKHFSQLRRDGVLVADSQPCYYLYRLTLGAQVQTGLVAVASVVAYQQQRIKKHELTRTEKEDDRVRHIEAVNAQTGPVFWVYRDQPAIRKALAGGAAGDADVDFTAADGVRHQLWRISNVARMRAISAAFNRLDALYIADGHHRAAAAARVAEKRRAAGASAADWTLGVLFPHTDVCILSYNRVVRDLNGLDSATFLQRLAAHFTVTPSAQPVAPAQMGEFGLYLERHWYHLHYSHAAATATSAANTAEQLLNRLDVNVLQTLVLEPLLGITDPRRDNRIDFVGGSRGLMGLTQRVDSGEMTVAFALCPTAMDDLLAVADANAIMPPKSTWFEPKLADGLVCHLLGE
ncbi:DUF1015 domain-containing protein [Thiospirillum jenense]|uniref:DUF1015 domain-containing protein n=1 Tax=Thiospirillum jenense TaxID=1653858 RepID=A0A839HIJ2_9GAMM|nr:DUF1015 family protein [Thiospirillum jenense]MBB1126728.1 DUF1015 domain-containing protein [Thiospirillum jenense]